MNLNQSQGLCSLLKTFNSTLNFNSSSGKELVIPMEVVYQNQILKSMTKWFRNGEQLVEEVGKISFSGDGTSLVIVNVESSSAGTYR